MAKVDVLKSTVGSKVSISNGMDSYLEREQRKIQTMDGKTLAPEAKILTSNQPVQTLKVDANMLTREQPVQSLRVDAETFLPGTNMPKDGNPHPHMLGTIPKVKNVVQDPQPQSTWKLPVSVRPGANRQSEWQLPQAYQQYQHQSNFPTALEPRPNALEPRHAALEPRSSGQGHITQVQGQSNQPAALEQSSSDQSHIVSVLEKQSEITALLVQQQSLSFLPKRDIQAFDGDPLQYHTFIRAFEHIIERKTDNPKDCLYFLEQYTRGQSRELVKSCQFSFQ